MVANCIGFCEHDSGSEFAEESWYLHCFVCCTCIQRDGIARNCFCKAGRLPALVERSAAWAAVVEFRV